MLRSSVPEKSKLFIAFSKLYHSSAKKSMQLEKKREKCRFHGLGILGKPISYGSARLGHIPSLPWEPQLPLKSCISLQPPDFEGNCDSLRFSPRFLLQFITHVSMQGAAAPCLKDALPLCPFGTFSHTVGNHPRRAEPARPQLHAARCLQPIQKNIF